MEKSEVYNWHNETLISKLKNNLEKRNISFFYLEDKKEIKSLLKEHLSDGNIVSFGGSATLGETGILDFLDEGNYNFLDRRKCTTQEEKIEVYRKSFFADAYFLSANAITLDGEILNVDGNGNRIAAMIYGPSKVYVIVGINKLVRDIEEAYTRLETYAGPMDCKILDKNTPCVKTGLCTDCASEDRICSKYVIYKRENINNRMHVILINESLGF